MPSQIHCQLSLIGCDSVASWKTRMRDKTTQRNMFDMSARGAPFCLCVCVYVRVCVCGFACVCLAYVSKYKQTENTYGKINAHINKKDIVRKTRCARMFIYGLSTPPACDNPPPPPLHGMPPTTGSTTVVLILMLLLLKL